MRNALLFISLFLLMFIGNAQVKRVEGQVFDAGTGQPLPFVNITINGLKQGTAADVDGKFTYSADREIYLLTFSFVGYERQDIKVDANTSFPIKIRLKELKQQLREVTVVAGENPAHRIIRKAVDNRSTNNPNHLESFRYRSYNKLVVGVNVDSLSAEIERDTIKVPEKDSTYVRLDSSNYETKKFFNRNHLFLMESVSERKYKRPNKDQERVLASRVSGFKDPTFTLLGTQFQSFSFYDDYITILFTEYLNPISPGSTKRYFFILQDTIFRSNGDTVYSIAFRPQPNTTFECLKGVLSINTKDWAIQHVVVSPAKDNGTMVVDIQQKYEQRSGHWFPVQLNYDFGLKPDSAQKKNTAMPFGKGRTFLQDIAIGEEYSRRDFRGADVKIVDDANKRDEAFWAQYRHDSLTVQDRNTYAVIDSIGEELKLDQKLKWFNALLNGKIRWGYVDFHLDRLLLANRYEVLRLGIGLSTSPKFSDWLTLGAWAGYGFGDGAWKYGGNVEMLFERNTNFSLNLSAQHELFETGGLDIAERDRFGFGSAETRYLLVDRFDRVDEFRADLGYNLQPNMRITGGLVHQFRHTLKGYSFLDRSQGYDQYHNGFSATFLEGNLRFAPKERYIEGPFGRRRITKTWPVYNLRYQHSLPELNPSSYAFNKLEAQAEWSFKTILLGQTRVQAKGGVVNGAIPYSFLFTGKGNRIGDQSLGIADDASFETMPFNTYLSDRYAQVHLRHSFGKRLFKGMRWQPTLEVTTAAVWGSLAEPDVHFGLSSLALDQGYFESGLELNSIYSGLGLGFYYRYGAYNTGDFNQDAAFKITYRADFSNLFGNGSVKVEAN